jgi:hypothetical protein
LFSFRRIAVLAAIAGCAVAAPAQAATTIGSVAPEGATVESCPGGGPLSIWQNQSPTGAVTATSAGVITSVSTKQTAGQAGHTFKVKVGYLNDRSFSPSANVTIRATSDSLTIAGTGSTETFATQIPIATGQGVVLFSADGTDCAFDTTDAGDQVLLNGDPEPGPGTSIFAQDGSTSARVNLAATIEPDADGDGFGDETQDACPSDPSTHTGACSADASVVATVTPSTIGVGDVAVMTGTVSNAGNASALASVLHLTTAAGLNIISSLPTAGCTFTTDLACPLGTLAKGASVPFIVVVKAASTGTKSLGASIASSTSDPNAGNNAAVGQVVVQNQVPLACHVPKLTGLTKDQAKRLLSALHCKLGKATKEKSNNGRRGTVRKQSVKAGSTRPAGTKVNVTLRK